MTTKPTDAPLTGGAKQADSPQLNLVDLSATADNLALPDAPPRAAESSRLMPGADVASDGSITFTPDTSMSAEKPDKPRVVKDDKGHVTEVNYPDGSARRFGYADDGTVNRVQEPDGRVFVLKDGKWEETENSKHRPGGAPPGQGGPSNKPENHDPPFVSISVADDGTVSYKTKDGCDVRDYPDGSSDTRNEKSGYIVHKDTDNSVDFVITGAGDMVIVHRDANGRPDKVTLDMMHTYHLENGKWVTADGSPAPVSELEVWNDGTITYVDGATGAWVSKRPDGTKAVRQGNGDRIETNARGQVVETQSGNFQINRKFTYDDQGNLTAVISDDGSKIEKDADGNWHDKDGNEIENVTVDADGTIHYVNDDDKLVTLKVDGSTTTTSMDADDIEDLAHQIGVAGDMPSMLKYQQLDEIKDQLEDMSPADRLALEKAYEARYGRKLTDDLKENFGADNVADVVKDLEVARLLDDARQRMSDSEYQQFVTDLNKFLQRAKTDGISDQQIGDTLDAFDKLLTEPQAKLDAKQRKGLALQMMGFAADPSSIDQGSHGTCAANDVEVITWTRHPENAAGLIAQVAIEGKYTATDGHEVMVPPENLIPQPGTEGRTNTDQRMFASQIFQATVLCDIGSRREPPVYYKQGQPSPGNSNGEYWVDENGKEVGPFKGLVPRDTVDELLRLNDDEGQYFIYSDSWGTSHVITFNSEEELREELAEAKEDGQFPIIIHVCSDDKLFNPSAKPGDFKKRDHVVVIDDYNPETGQVRIDNSWGDEDDKWVDVADLYQATVPYTPPPKDQNYNRPAA